MFKGSVVRRLRALTGVGILGILLSGCGDSGDTLTTSGETAQVASLPANYASNGIPRIYEDTADMATFQDGSKLFLTHANINGQEEGFAQLFPPDGSAPTYFRVIGSEGSGVADLQLEEVGPSDELLDDYHLDGSEDGRGHLQSIQLTQGSATANEPAQALNFVPSSVQTLQTRARESPASALRTYEVTIVPNADVKTLTTIFHSVTIPVLRTFEKTWFLPEVWRMARDNSQLTLKEIYYVWWPGQQWACCDCWYAGIQIFKGDLPFKDGILSSQYMENPRFGSFTTPLSNERLLGFFFVPTALIWP
jgi:hypothetical protein